MNITATAISMIAASREFPKIGDPSGILIIRSPKKGTPNLRKLPAAAVGLGFRV